MDKRFAIFDMDGTLIDSMPAWKSLGTTFLRECGIEPPSDLRKKVAKMTMLESGEYFNSLGIKGTAQEIAADLNACMERQYRTTIAEREGVKKYLEALKAKNVRCCVATATDLSLAKACLTRLGLMSFFEFAVSCEDIGVTKHQPDIYFEAAKRLGGKPCDIAVYEDVPYAAKTAKDAGFFVVGVFDPACEAPQEQLREYSNEYIKDYTAAARTV